MAKKKDNIIDAVLTIKMAHDSKTNDATIIARFNLLALEIANKPNITVEELKDTIGFRSTIHNITFDDAYLQSLLDEEIVKERC